MLYSKSMDDNKFGLFTLFLNQLIKGETRYKENVDRVILDAHKLAIGKKNLYSVDRDKFSIIVFLQRTNSEYFKKIDPEHISKNHYKKVLQFLTDQQLPRA
jgi:hypothetical protein